MNEQTLQKQQQLIEFFGSIEKYQENIFEKVPPLFEMVCDENGNVTIDEESVGRYIHREMAENNITFEKLVERDLITFSTIIDNYHSRIFKNNN